MFPKILENKLLKLQSSYEKEDNLFTKKRYEMEVIGNKMFRIQNEIDYIKNTKSLKPQILFNYGRDKKYVYGQIYYFIEPQSTDKKSFRFMIGKMSEKKSRKEWNKICMDKFLNNIIN